MSRHVEDTKRRALKPILVVFLVLTGLAVLSACSSNGTIGGGHTNGAASHMPAPSRVLVLAPKLKFETVSTESPLDGGSYQATELGAKIVSLSVACLREKSVTKVELADSQRPEVARIVETANRAFSGTPDPQLAGLIRSLGPAGEPAAVLVQYVRVKVGVGPTWDPNSGIIGSRTSSSQFRAALFDTRSGQIIWRDAVEMRDVPVPNGETLEKTVRKLLSTIHPR